MDRNEYSLQLSINGRQLSRVIIDQHYQEKHGDLNDDLILKLVKPLDGGNFDIQRRSGDFEYFAIEPIYLEEKTYRVVLVLCIVDDYLGVVNAFRVRRGK